LTTIIYASPGESHTLALLRICFGIRRKDADRVFRSRESCRLQNHSGTFKGDSRHFRIYEREGHLWAFLHIQHQRRTKTGKAYSLVVPNARICDPRRAAFQQAKPQSLRGIITFWIQAFDEIRIVSNVMKIVSEIGEIVDIGRDLFFIPVYFF
jgi:hypothetical protein